MVSLIAKAVLGQFAYDCHLLVFIENAVWLYVILEHGVIGLVLLQDSWSRPISLIFKAVCLETVCM